MNALIKFHVFSIYLYFLILKIRTSIKFKFLKIFTVDHQNYKQINQYRVGHPLLAMHSSILLGMLSINL
jgi:hypothetical protein